MIVTLPETLLQQMLAGPDSAGSLFGRRLDGDDVAQILSLSDDGTRVLGRWERGAGPPSPKASPAPLLVVADPGSPQAARAYQHDGQQWVLVSCDVIRLRADYASRLAGLFEVDTLAAICITMIGLGSGGSIAAAQLARCGVGHMRLIDYDRLETHNLTRHACGLRDIGRYKTRAVRDLLLDVSPLIRVETYEANILESPAVLAQALDGCDLVVAATDSEVAKAAINRAAWTRGIPAVYGAAYNRAFGGDIFRAVPPDGPCYACFQRVLAEFFAPPPTAAADFAPGYADLSRMADLVAEPGLAMDVAMIATLLARVSLHTLLRGQPTALPDLPTAWLLYGNRAEWIFERPLEALFVEIEKQPDCPVCNYDGYVRHHLQMTSAEAAAEAERLLAELDEDRSKGPGE